MPAFPTSWTFFPFSHNPTHLSLIIPNVGFPSLPVNLVRLFTPSPLVIFESLSGNLIRQFTLRPFGVFNMPKTPDDSTKDKMSESAEGGAPLISMRQLELINIGIRCSKDKGGVSSILSIPSHRFCQVDLSHPTLGPRWWTFPGSGFLSSHRKIIQFRSNA